MIKQTHSKFSLLPAHKACWLSALSCFMLGAALAAEPSDEQAASTPAPSYTVAQSTPIDKLVHTLYANSPLNTTVLRQALVDANPKIITGNPQQRVKAGLSIVVPDHAQVVKAVLTPLAAPATETQEPGPSAREYSARRQWVRFP